MPQEVTRRRFMFQTMGVIGGATVSGDLLPLLAEAAKRKQVLRVAIERDFETLRPELSAGDTANLLRRLIYTTPILWGMQQRSDGSLIYNMDSIEMVLATAYKVSEDRQLIEFTLHPSAKFATCALISCTVSSTPKYVMDRNHYGNSSKQYTGPAVSSASNPTSPEVHDSQMGLSRPHALPAWGADHPVLGRGGPARPVDCPV